MIHTVIGGNGSGKSSYGEEWILQKRTGEEPVIYLATMEVLGEEGRQKVRKHREQRAGRGFFTIEALQDFSNICIPENQGILLECISNLAANIWYPKEGEKKSKEAVYERVKEEVDWLSKQTKNLVIVTNDISRERIKMEAFREFQWMLGRINCHLAKCSDKVTEVVGGIPISIKGEEI